MANLGCWWEVSELPSFSRLQDLPVLHLYLSMEPRECLRAEVSGLDGAKSQSPSPWLT